jgi:hypothetical protein
MVNSINHALKRDISGALCASVFCGLYDSNQFKAMKAFVIYMGIAISWRVCRQLILDFKSRSN